MKHSTMNWMIAAAALVVAAGSASAQTFNAEIPMAFRVGEKVMAPGPYQIRVATGGNVQVFVYGLETHSSAIVLSGPQADAPKDWRREGQPKIAFECAGNTCSMRQLWDGKNRFAYGFNVHKEPTLEARRMEVVTLAMTKVR